MGCVGLSRDIEEIDTHEDDQEAANERYCVGGRSCVEALEEDGGGNDGGGGEEDVVNWVDAIR